MKNNIKQVHYQRVKERVTDRLDKWLYSINPKGYTILREKALKKMKIERARILAMKKEVTLGDFSEDIQRKIIAFNIDYK